MPRADVDALVDDQSDHREHNITHSLVAFDIAKPPCGQQATFEIPRITDLSEANLNTKLKRSSSSDDLYTYTSHHEKAVISTEQGSASGSSTKSSIFECRPRMTLKAQDSCMDINGEVWI